MPHRFDRGETNTKAVEQMKHARQWHEKINNQLKKHGHKSAPLMKDAIDKAYRYGLIEERTVRIAHEIRKQGNQGRHQF